MKSAGALPKKIFNNLPFEMANGEFWRESKNACPAPPSHPPREQPTSPRPQEHGGHGDINFYIWDINLPGNHPGEQISSLHCVSINNTTNCSNEPVRVRPNPRPQKGVAWSGLVWFRKSKRNNKPNHKQFIIHESINTHSTKTGRTPRSEATQSRRHQWKIAPRHRADGPPVLRRTKSDG